MTWLIPGRPGHRRGGRRLSTSEKFDGRIDARLTIYGGGGHWRTDQRVKGGSSRTLCAGASVAGLFSAFRESIGIRSDACSTPGSRAARRCRERCRPRCGHRPIRLGMLRDTRLSSRRKWVSSQPCIGVRLSGVASGSSIVGGIGITFSTTRLILTRLIFHICIRAPSPFGSIRRSPVRAECGSPSPALGTFSRESHRANCARGRCRSSRSSRSRLLHAAYGSSSR